MIGDLLKLSLEISLSFYLLLSNHHLRIFSLKTSGNAATYNKQLQKLKTINLSPFEVTNITVSLVPTHFD